MATEAVLPTANTEPAAIETSLVMESDPYQEEVPPEAHEQFARIFHPETVELHKLLKPQVPSHIASPTVLATLYDFPTMEPLNFLYYPSTHLHLPLRRDLLHRAVVFEGDATRQGTASTKWRDEVHGSKRKIRPQKGTGRARLGDKKSPMLRGGGRAFGPKPRDFGTGLPWKIYDMAWRTALSYRYRRSELIIVDTLELQPEEGGKAWMKKVFGRLRWGQGHGRSTLIAGVEEEQDGTFRYSEEKQPIFEGLEDAREEGRALWVDDVDVKDLLTTKRLVVEKSALDWMLKRHQRDLLKRAWLPPDTM